MALPDKRSYEFFSRWVSGGKICFHIFELEKCEKYGKHSILVEAQVWEKEYNNGVISSYLDLYPTAEKITHSVRKCADYSILAEAMLNEELVFKFCKGALVFTPLKEN